MGNRRHRKVLALFAACTMLGFLGLVASPSVAHDPNDTQADFSPDDFNGGGHPDVTGGTDPDHCDPVENCGEQTKEAQVVSDASIGLPGSFTLRGAASPDASFMEWYSCESGDVPTSDGADCAPIATDTSADPAPTPPGEDATVAFQARYDISQQQEDNNPTAGSDWYAVACTNDARPGGPAYDTSHCNHDGVFNVHQDNAQATGDHDPTSAGRIHMLVTPRGTFTDTASVHGAGLKNGEEVTVIAFTSPTAADAIHFCWDFDSDANTNNNNGPNAPSGGGCDHDFTDETGTPGGGSGCHAQAPVVPGGVCWSASGTPFANEHFGLSIIEYDDGDSSDGVSSSGSGDCIEDTEPSGGDTGDDCQLDKIFVSTTLAGEPIPGAGPGPAPPVTTGLCDPNRATAAVAEILIGTRGNDLICGFAGGDTLRGLPGNDRLLGGAGNDAHAGGPGRDLARGSSGNDLLRGGGDSDNLKGGTGKDTARGGPSSDSCSAEFEKSC